MRNTLFLAIALLGEVTSTSLCVDNLRRRLQDSAERRAFEAVGPESSGQLIMDDAYWEQLRDGQRRNLADVDPRWLDVISDVGVAHPPTTGKLRVLFAIAAFNDTPESERFRVPADQMNDRMFNPELPAGASPPQPIDVLDIDPMYQLNEWTKAMSSGNVEFEWTYVRVVLRQNHPGDSAEHNFCNWCTAGAGQGFEDVMNDAMTRAMENGCNTTYTHFDMMAVQMPYVTGCHGAVASTPGAFVWFNGASMSTSASRTYRHEFGHMLGLMHAEVCNYARRGAAAAAKPIFSRLAHAVEDKLTCACILLLCYPRLLASAPLLVFPIYPACTVQRRGRQLRVRQLRRHHGQGQVAFQPRVPTDDGLA